MGRKPSIYKELEGMRMPKKRLPAAEKRRRTNAQQKSYRERNPELVDLWRQRSYANFLRDRGWKLIPPEGMKTPEQVREKRDLLRQLEGPPVDLADLDFEEILKNIGPDELPFP